MSIKAFKVAAERNPPLRAPYNFVPLNETVLPTPLNDDPDLGTPLEKGLSGEILVEWRVETPLLVGGSAGGREEAEENNNRPFRLPDGRYAIPGASLRGMIRSVLEILSYAHLEPIADGRFGLRDFDSFNWQQALLRDRNLAGKAKAMVNRQGTPFTARLPFASWLEARFEKGACVGGTLTAVASEDIPVAAIATALNITDDDWHRSTLIVRHDMLRAAGLEGEIDLGAVMPGLAGRRGTLVVAGRALRDPGQITNKNKETVFLAGQGTPFPIGQAAFDAFDAIQVTDGNRHPGAPVENWSYWRRQLERGERVPVFFRGDPARAAAGVPQSNAFVMSLTRFMRIPHRHTVHEVRARGQKPLSDSRLDFVQALFGHVPPERSKAAKSVGRQRAWRSRVRFGMATLAEGCEATVLDARRAVTMRPRASYFPFYLRPVANADKAAVTHPVDWSSDHARLAGRKRYPARNAESKDLPRSPRENPEQENDLVFLNASPERPLVFRSAVRFHNVLPKELGGIVWAVGLGGRDGKNRRRLRHMLGRAKAFGYGQTQALLCEPPRIERNDGAAAPTLTECATAFDAWLKGSFGDQIETADRPEVAALLAMCDADHGAALQSCLAFPESGRSSEHAERILEAYSTVKKTAANVANARNSHWLGGKPISRDPEDSAFLFLPDYPLPGGDEN